MGLFITSCGIYKFSGASISPDVKTISIAVFDNKAAIVVPTLSQSFTEELRNRYVNQTRLGLVLEKGDLNISGSIIGYKIIPVAPSGNETTILTRLSIGVKVSYTNTKDETQNFEKSWERFADFQSSLNLADVEESLIEEITEQLVDAIFNETVANW